jgi:predicted esterase
MPTAASRVLTLAALAAAALPSVVACSSGTEVRAVFVASGTDALAGDTFYDHPFPSDARLAPDGSLRFDGLTNPTQNVLVETYVAATRGLEKGASPAATVFLRFGGALDPASLPATPKDALAKDAAIQLVDVDPASPEHGERKLVEWFFRAKEGVFWRPNTLAVMPARGYPLRPRTRYALVVTTRARSADGGLVRASDDLIEVLGLSTPTARTEAVRKVYAPAIAELEQAGVAPKQIANLAVFTTNDPIGELFQIADFVRSSYPAPAFDPDKWAAPESKGAFDLYVGEYGPSPDFQAGAIPFEQNGSGGSFAFGADGKPIVQREFSLRCAIAVPDASRCPMPAAGYPIVLYAHGTGGDYKSFTRDGTAGALAARCLASMGIDQIFHGTRPGAPPANEPNREGKIQTLFFNLNNPLAARTNGRQAAVDVTQQARLFTEAGQTIPASVSLTKQEIRFDGSKVLFFGHSQGGVNGPLFLAADPQARGGILSGTGAVITIALLEKTEPAPSVAAAVKAILGLYREENADELNAFHPILALAQSIVDPTDPVHYMPHIVSSPRPGFRPKSILQTEGVSADGSGDKYTPPHSIEVASVAMGLPLLAPMIKPRPEAAWGGLADGVEVPASGLRGNLAGGQASGGLVQFEPVTDGHFVVFDVPAAKAQAADFCMNLAADPVGTVPRAR